MSKRKVITAREQYELLNPWRIAAPVAAPSKTDVSEDQSYDNFGPLIPKPSPQLFDQEENPGSVQDVLQEWSEKRSDPNAPPGPREPIAPWANKLEHSLYQEFMDDWWPNSQSSVERGPGDVLTGWRTYPNEPITHWLNVEDFLKERYPEAATGGQYGWEEAGEALSLGKKNDWNVPQDVLDQFGYSGSGNVITQAMLNLHNKLQGREWASDADKYRYYELMLKHIGPGARRLSRLLRTAYHITVQDFDDDDPDDDEGYDWDDSPYYAAAWDGWEDDDDDDEEAPPKRKHAQGLANTAALYRDDDEALGDCYEAATRYLMDHALGMGVKNPNNNLRLVHGEVAMQGRHTGKTMGHAWIEDGNTVIDQSNGRDVRMPKNAYYDLGKINELNNFHSYAPEEARRRLIDLQHYGPWDLSVNGEPPPGRVELEENEDDEWDDDDYYDDSEDAANRLGKTAQRFWAMASPEDAYDQNPNDYQRAQIEAPLQQNTSGKWYHVSPHKMDLDTILSPGGGTSPYNYNNADMPTQRQKDWVWMDGPDAVKQWYYGTLMGQIQQGNENPWAHIYEVEPSEGPWPWNKSGTDGHVAPSARIVREIATDKYNRLPDDLEGTEAPKTASLRFWAMADTTKWHPLIKHEPYGTRNQSGIYHITIPEKWSTTGRRVGDLSYTRSAKGEKHYVIDEATGRYTYKPRTNDEVYIDSLVVHPDHQGQGVAQALIERLNKDLPTHRINPGATTPQGQGFTQRMLETNPGAQDIVAPNWTPHILDDEDTEDYTTSELERLVNAKLLTGQKLWQSAEGQLSLQNE